ncbi:protein FMC1 homolog isoform X2 [Physella acuta]|uniref:protein FMC1 homolog isoform X2 n=1 Tax=Physella acuta TaxID=109671 RepID=UPI0027DC0E7D|nr:protein FMC1 homolog isoform X2 [Physella acuta]
MRRSLVYITARRSAPNKNLSEVPIYVYLQDQFHYFRTTGEKICREKHEVEHLAQTYLCYLNSLRKQEELAVQYRGRGERSVESSANIVGLKLPKLYSEDASQKPPEN